MPPEHRTFSRRRLLAGLGGLAALGVGLGVGRELPHGDVGARSARPTDLIHGGVGAQVIWRVNTLADSIALTFDDGPDPRWTPMVLRILRRHNAKATFFMIGEHAARHPDLVRKVVDEGHEVGNHTWTHRRLDRADLATDLRELRRTDILLTHLIGRPPALFRPPWGKIDPVGLLAAAELNYRVVLWSDLVRGAHARSDLTNVLAGVRPGAIILGHDGGSTPNYRLMTAFETLTRELTRAGHHLVTVSEALTTTPTATPSP